MCDGMVETEHIGMEAKPADRIVSVSIFHISTDRMPHVGRVDTYLVFAPGLEPIFHQRMFRRAVEHMEVR